MGNTFFGHMLSSLRFHKRHRQLETPFKTLSPVKINPQSPELDTEYANANITLRKKAEGNKQSGGAQGKQNDQHTSWTELCTVPMKCADTTDILRITQVTRSPSRTLLTLLFSRVQRRSIREHLTHTLSFKDNIKDLKVIKHKSLMVTDLPCHQSCVTLESLNNTARESHCIQVEPLTGQAHTCRASFSLWGWNIPKPESSSPTLVRVRGMRWVLDHLCDSTSTFSGLLKSYSKEKKGL